jgi:hypothetical protein
MGLVEPLRELLERRAYECRLNPRPGAGEARLVGADAFLCDCGMLARILRDQ